MQKKSSGHIQILKVQISQFIQLVWSGIVNYQLKEYLDIVDDNESKDTKQTQRCCLGARSI